ncbi:MAG: YbaN family protein [Pseudomonadota bacterium]
MIRNFYALLGWLCVGLGLLGVPLPGLPTVPFMILAAAFFAKGSPRARAWLMGHETFGPHIAQWEQHGAISRRAKGFAVGTMTLVFTLSAVFQAPWYLLVFQAACMVPAAAFVLTRPDSAPDQSTDRLEG